MRRWIDLIERIDVPPTQYGYWIDASGEIIPVDDCQHWKVMRQNGFTDYDDAYDNGWIRCVVHYVNNNAKALGKALVIQTDTGIISVRGMTAISALARESEIVFYSAEIKGNYQSFTEVSRFLSFVQSERVRPPARELADTP